MTLLMLDWDGIFMIIIDLVTVVLGNTFRRN